jgi:hypothetical protein
VTSASYNKNGICIVARSGLNNVYLATGYRDIFGVFYVNCLRRCSATNSLAAADNTTVAAMKARDNNPAAQYQSIQYADVYHVAFPGQEQKPYDVAVIKKLEDAGTIDWSTQLFREDKVDVARAILEVEGDGLNDAQKASLQQSYSDACRGV